MEMGRIIGEVNVWMVNVVLTHSNLKDATTGQTGKLQLTNYKLDFTPKDQTIHKYNAMFFLPLLAIKEVDSRTDSDIIIKSKDNRELTFEVLTSDLKMDKFVNFKRLLMHYAFPNFTSAHDLTATFPFVHFEAAKRSIDVAVSKSFWDIYDPVEEFERLGVLDDSKWRVSSQNLTYRLCPTYPYLLVVPSQVSDEDLWNVREFRSLGRIPYLTWYHSKSRVGLLRCAQPMVGLKGAFGRGRSFADERYIDSAGPKISILDCRPKKNAYANLAAGKGFEMDRRYGDSNIEFLNIENIHVMRDSMAKFMDAVGTGNTSAIRASKWFSHMKVIMAGAKRVMEQLRSGTSIICHCSDGWDRTAQICSLAQVCLDPFYRSRKGFAILVEKDWISAGHRFHKRIGHGYSTDPTQHSPIFLQFLDAIFQLTCVFPRAFEFNGSFLCALFDEVLACRFGTFLFDSERERRHPEVDVANSTFSVWEWLLSERPDLSDHPLATRMELEQKNCGSFNPFVNRHYKKRAGELPPPLDSENYHVFPFHDRWSTSKSKKNNEDWKSRCLFLESRIQELEEQLKGTKEEKIGQISQIEEDLVANIEV